MGSVVPGRGPRTCRRPYTPWGCDTIRFVSTAPTSHRGYTPAAERSVPLARRQLGADRPKLLPASEDPAFRCRPALGTTDLVGDLGGVRRVLVGCLRPESVGRSASRPCPRATWRRARSRIHRGRSRLRPGGDRESLGATYFAGRAWR